MNIQKKMWKVIKMENKELMVTIPLSLYNDLLKTKFDYENFKSILMDKIENATLNYNKTELYFDTDDAREILKK